jgi:hypothetical protein
MNVNRIGANVAVPRPNIGATAASATTAVNSGIGSAVTGLFSGATGILLAIVVLVIVFAIYYQTIGYYIQIGWEKLGWSRTRHERVEIRAPGGLTAELTPAGGAAGAGIIRDVEQTVDRLESDVETALGLGAGKKEVFNISRNLYTFGEAEPLCRAFGAELATYDQVKDAYESGADWCNYGWVKGQLAVYPTQESTYQKLQHGPEEDRMSCGLPGVNGGYFPNATQRFGVNCYGPRPAEKAIDERVQHEERSDTAFDREVNKFRSEIDSIAVNPWNRDQWSN